VPDQGQKLTRTQSASPARPGGSTDLGGLDDWRVILDQLESDVSRAERLAVGTRMINGQVAPLAPSDEADGTSPGGGATSDEILARMSVPLPDEPPWEPPRGHLPAGYAERARALLDRQIAIAAHIVREITMGRQQAAYAHHIEELEEVKATPAFIDEAI